MSSPASPPVVTIITPTHNRAALLAEALESVRAQTYRNFEALVLDDGSTDETERVVRALDDSRIDYVRLDRVGRISTLRNLGLRRARGRYIAFIDSDDVWEPSKLARQVAMLEADPELGFVYSDVSLFDEAGVVRPGVYEKLASKLRQSGTDSDFRRELMTFEIFVRPSTLLLRASCLATVGGIDERFPCGENEWVARLACAYPSRLEPRPLVRARMHSGSASAVRPEDGFAEVVGAANRFLATKELPPKQCAELLASAHKRLAGIHWRRGRWLAAAADWARVARALAVRMRLLG